MSRPATLGQLVLPVGPRDHMIGPKTAAVTLVEYGDYQCPFCGQAHPIVASLLQEFADDLRFVFRHFPLTTVHPYAEQAAEAAESAAAQGKFWEMHSTLYENQDALDSDSLVTYARAFELDVRRFVSELASHAHIARVREDFMSGVRSGVSGTPAFFINGMRHDGPWDFRSLATAIEHQLSDE